LAGRHSWRPRWTAVRRWTYDLRPGQGDYESKDNAGHKFWVARCGRYAIRIDATRPGVYPWFITLEGRMSARVSSPTVTRLLMR
jgi:hypothetical protein